MGWRELRNAPLIEAFGRYTDPRGAIMPSGPLEKDKLLRGRVSELLVEKDLVPAYTELSGEYGPHTKYGWRLGTMCALMVWDDMHAILGMDLEELRACIHMFPDTELAGRCEAAIRFHTFVPARRAYELCASIANREVDERAARTSDVAASQCNGGEESEGDRHEAP